MQQALRADSPFASIDLQLTTILRLVKLADRFTNEPLPASLVTQVRLEFAQLVRAFDESVRAMQPADVPAFGQHVQAAAMPLMRRTENGWRWYRKPRGYAGDYATIARMYDDQARGCTAVDRLLDRCFLDFPAVFAVQHRRALLASELRATIRGCADCSPARITSLACGPAREVFDLFASLNDPRAAIASLVDFDAEALAYCHAERSMYGLQEQITLVEANLIHVAVGRRGLDLRDQDLVYSIGLIDYFDDDLVVKLLDWIHGILRPGGRVILGNFHPYNPTRAVMDHVLEWRLVHRDEAAMHRLVRASAFGTQCSRIFYEPQRINLFAEARKEPTAPPCDRPHN